MNNKEKFSTKKRNFLETFITDKPKTFQKKTWTIIEREKKNNCSDHNRVEDENFRNHHKKSNINVT